VFGGVGKGDQLVTVIVEIPRDVSKRQQELLEELAKDMGEQGLVERRRFLDKLRALFS
jgi:molecular chaperone DnaJ